MRGALVLVGLLVTTPAQAFDWSSLLNPFKTPLEVWVGEIEEARSRGEYDLAQSLLDEALRSYARTPAPLILQRGLLLRDRNKLDLALPVLAQAADLDPSSSARVEQAAVLVALGRWPEAVEVLTRAFAERGSNLKADTVISDPRFAPLVDFAPYKDLIARVRAEQSGPFGRLLLKFEQIEAAARSAQQVMTRLSSWMSMLGRLATYQGSAVVALLAMGIFFAFGVSQLGLLRRPWPLLLGMLTASGLWHVGARIVTLDKSWGLSTILPALGLVAGVYLVIVWGRSLLRRHRLRRLDRAALERIVLRSEEIARLGRSILSGADEDQAQLRKALVDKLDEAV